MSKTKNSRHEICEYISKNHDNTSIWVMPKSVTVKFSRHPNKRSRHSLTKQWAGVGKICYKIYTWPDKRIGPCDMRSDRLTGAKYVMHTVRRRTNKKIIENELKDCLNEARKYNEYKKTI